MKTEETPKTCTNSDAEKIHWLIHDACYEIEHGTKEKALELLSQADKLSHDLVAQFSPAKNAEELELKLLNRLALFENEEGGYLLPPHVRTLIAESLIREGFFASQSSKIEEHKCKYCGVMTTQPDSECYKASVSNSVIIDDFDGILKA